jgi:Flp pilus assembly protein TadB
VSLSDIKDKVDSLPLAKKATPSQMILLLVCAAGIFGFGAKIAWWAADTRTAIVQGINDVGSKTEQVNAKVEAVRQSQEWLRASTMSKADMAKWAQSLDRLNRKIQAGEGLQVPEVPEITMPAAISAPTR